MKIVINDNFKLCEIRGEFNKHFPYLKLIFLELKLTKKSLFRRKADRRFQ